MAKQHWQRSWIPALIAIALLFPATVDAQTASSSRLWFSAGAGGGWTRMSCAICRAQRQLGPVGYVRVLTPAGHGVLVGAELNAWTRPGEEEGRDWARSYSAVAYLYPKPNGPFFVKSGLGWLGYDVGGELSTGSVGVQLGAGYEFRIGSRLYLTNSLNLTASSFGALKSDDARVVDDVGVTVLQLGVGVTRR